MLHARRLSLALGLALLAVAPRARAQSAPSFLELADRLRNVGSYDACTVEALRYAYQNPAERERGFDRAALCLSLAGRFEDAHRLISALPSEGTAPGPRARLRLCLTEVFLPDLAVPACPALEPAGGPAALTELGSAQGSRCGRSKEPSQGSCLIDAGDQLARAALRMRAVRARRWADAARLEPPAAPGSVASLWLQQDRELMGRWARLPRKSPWLAGALSAVVPGLGRVYIGRWPDGLVSFLLVGLTGALAAQGFYDDGRDSVRGWILGSVAALLYVGNVYGSAIGAVVARREAEDALMQEIDRAYQRRLDATLP